MWHYILLLISAEETETVFILIEISGTPKVKGQVSTACGVVHPIIAVLFSTIPTNKCDVFPTEDCTFAIG